MKKKISPRDNRDRSRSQDSRVVKKNNPAMNESWSMRLYVAGQSARSLAAITNLRRICDSHMPGRCTVEVIDLMRNPELARDDQIVAIPTLVRKLPAPARRIIGDLSATEKVLIALELSVA
ncbi:MAG: circadian clock KaiB family protein [Candidatus Binatus sp.]